MGLRLYLFWSVYIQFRVPIKLFSFFFTIKRNICFNPFSLQFFSSGCLEALKKTRKKNKGGALSHIHCFHQHPSLYPSPISSFERKKTNLFISFFHSKKKIMGGGRTGLPTFHARDRTGKCQKKNGQKTGIRGTPKNKTASKPYR